MYNTPPPFGQRIDIGGNLGAFAKRFRGQMGVAFGGVNRGMAEQILNLINWHAVIHQNAGKAMAQIMQPEIPQARSTARFVPRPI